MRPCFNYIVVLLLVLLTDCSTSAQRLGAALAPLVLTSEDTTALDQLAVLVFANVEPLIVGAANHSEHYPASNSAERGHAFYTLPAHLLRKYLTAHNRDLVIPEIPAMRRLSAREQSRDYELIFRPADRALILRLCQRSAGDTVVLHLVANYPRGAAKTETLRHSFPLNHTWTYLVISYTDDEWS